MGWADRARAEDIIVGRSPLFWTISSKSDSPGNIRSCGLEGDWGNRGLIYDAAFGGYRCNVNRLDQIRPLIHQHGDESARKYLDWVEKGIAYSKSATLDTIDHETFLDERRSTSVSFESGKKLLRFKKYKITWIMSKKPEDWVDFLDDRKDGLNWVYLKNSGSVRCWEYAQECKKTGKHLVVLTSDDFQQTSDVWATLGGGPLLERVVFDRLFYEEDPSSEMPIRFGFRNLNRKSIKECMKHFLCLYDEDCDPLKKTKRRQSRNNKNYGYYMDHAYGYFDVFRICLGIERFYPFTRSYFRASTFNGKTFDQDLENVLRNNFYFDFKEV
jgi:hypothetical protein